MRNAGILTGLIVSLLFATPGRADPVIDQESAGTVSASQAISSTGTLAQTFRAGRTGDLRGVDLYVGDDDDILPGEDLLLEVRDTSGGAPGTNLLGQVTIPRASVSGYDWIHVDLPDTGVPVTAGNLFALVLSTSRAWSSDGNYRWGGRILDPYANGAAWQKVGAAEWSVAEAGGDPFDRNFRTWVEVAALVDPVTGLEALIVDLDVVIEANPGEKWAKKLVAARKSVLKALAVVNSVPAGWAKGAKYLEKIVKSIGAAGAKGFADAADFERAAAEIAMAVATHALEAAIDADGDAGRIAIASSMLGAARTAMSEADYPAVADLCEKSAKDSDKAW